MADDTSVTGLDLRLVVPAGAVWAGALVGTSVAPRASVSVAVLLALAAVALAALAAPRRRSGGAPTTAWVLVAALVCSSAAMVSAAARIAALDRGPVAELAAAEAVVRAVGVVLTDPARRTTSRGPTGGTPYVLVRARLEEVSGRGRTHTVRAPVLLIADDSWLDVRPGQRVAISGRLAEARATEGLAALLRVRAPPDPRGRPGLGQRWTEPVRAGLRGAVDGLPADPRGLVPALVVGDESAMTPELEEAMRRAGLLHLNAVSGANVAIVLGAVLGVSRRAGLRARALPVVGAVAVVAFVVLARPQPSVLRAAAMGLVILAALGSSGRRRGQASLCLAVLLLCSVDPFLGRSAGFALSVLATAGILVLAPPWSAAATWLPSWAAQAVAVPLAASLVCTPLVVALSGELSLVGLPANVLVAPAVAPTTLLGAWAAVVAPWWEAGGSVLGRLAGLPAAWIVAVARTTADLPGAARPLSGAGWAAVLALLAGTGLALAAVRPVLRRWWLTAALSVLLVLAVVRGPAWPRLDGVGPWPPAAWSVVACDVGQGDAVVLRAGPESAVLVDAGPEPALVDQCLDGLGVRELPLVVLTHFHADHVAGLPGALVGRDVGRVLTSPLAAPSEAVRAVAQQTAARGLVTEPARAGAEGTTGEVTWEVLWPSRLLADSGSPPNDASLVLVAEVGGLRVLLTGDVEPPAQRAIRASGVDVRADVLKVPHHGSAHQDDAFLDRVDAEVALVSAGEDNTYGHPAAETLDDLRRAGAVPFRTDVHGSVALRRVDGGIVVSTQRDG